MKGSGTLAEPEQTCRSAVALVEGLALVAEKLMDIAQAEDLACSVLPRHEARVVNSVSDIEAGYKEVDTQYQTVLQARRAKSRGQKVRLRLPRRSVLHCQEFPISWPVSGEGRLKRAPQHCSPAREEVMTLQAQQQNHWRSVVRPWM